MFYRWTVYLPLKTLIWNSNRQTYDEQLKSEKIKNSLRKENIIQRPPTHQLVVALLLYEWRHKSWHFLFGFRPRSGFRMKPFFLFIFRHMLSCWTLTLSVSCRSWLYYFRSLLHILFSTKQTFLTTNSVILNSHPFQHIATAFHSYYCCFKFSGMGSSSSLF